VTAAQLPKTEAELIKLVTHVDCLTCSVRLLVLGDFLEPFEDVETLRMEVPTCRCNDPLSEWIIYSDQPLFPEALNGEVDAAAEIRSTLSGTAHWEYTVDEDLVEDLGIQS
jgi:hypothetical protein